MNETRLTAVHLCCGAGGTTLGFHRAGIATVYAFDYSEVVVRTHRANFPDSPCELRDIRAIDIGESPHTNVWTCGIPCAPYSNAGARQQENDPRDISADLRRLIRCASERGNLPDSFFFENVPPYMKSLAAKKLRGQLEDLGYKVHEAIFKHANYGVPQARKRWHLMASRSGSAPVPMPTHNEQHDLFGLEPWIRFGEIREHNANGVSMLTPRVLRGALRRQRRKVKRAIEYGGSAYNVMQVVTDEDMLPTVTASWYMGIARNQVTAVACQCDGHWYYRMPTELEIRRGQGFPDDFIFHGNKRERWEQIGRAVPPPFAEAVARAILERMCH